MADLKLCALVLLLSPASGWAATDPPQIVFHIIRAESGEPLAGATLKIEHDFGEWSGVSNADGAIVFKPPSGGVTFATMTCEARGRVTLRQRPAWQNGEIDLPMEQTWPMPVGTSAGGTIVDQAGRPIPNVEVRVSAAGPVETPRQFVLEHSVHTDDQGRWEVDVLPAEISRLTMTLAHPMFVHDAFSATAETAPPLSAFRDGDAVLRLREGVIVWGRVIDEAGEPIAGATIEAGRFDQGVTSEITTTSDDGAFRFTIDPTDVTVMARAPGRAPTIVRVPKESLESPLQITVPEGGVIHGMVTDDRGEPIPGASFTIDSWAGSSHGRWRFNTDENGRFVWDSAPVEGEIKLSVSRGGYVGRRSIPAQPGDDLRIMLEEEQIVTGLVADAETGEGVPNFRVTPGYSHGPDVPLFYATGYAVQASDGEFTIGFDGEHSGIQLIVEAEGYLPAKSRLFTQDEGSWNWNVALTPGHGPRGIVRDSQGQPIPNANIRRTMHDSCPVFASGSFYGNTVDAFSADDAGAFELAPALDRFAVIVLQEEGFAALSDDELEDRGDIVLQPWCHIEGRCLEGNTPVVGATIELTSFSNSYDELPDFQFSDSTTTDADGRFTFDRVPSGLVQISQLLAKRRSMPVTVQRKTLDLEAGEVTSVTLGGDGVNVLGRIVPANGLDPTRPWNYGGTAMLMTPQIDWAYPGGYTEWDDERQRAWWNEWRRGPECDEILLRRFRHSRKYNFDIEADGSLHIADVEPGEYRLYIRFIDPDSLVLEVFGAQLGVVDMSVRVPAEPDQDILDLGDIEMAIAAALPVGSMAPDLTVATMDGDELDLADLRGQFVLLDFWATWCSPCVAELPGLKAVYDRYRDRGLEIISLSFDHGPEAPRAHFERNGYDWKQAFLGYNEERISRRFGVYTIPSITLIDPQGRVLATGLTGEAIREAVEAAIE